MKIKWIALLSFCLFGIIELYAQPKWFRMTYRDDPSTTAVVGWSGASAILYYDTINHYGNFSGYAQNTIATRSTVHKGESHYFTRLSNLDPGKVYYFMLRYNSNDTTTSYSFRTLSDDSNQPLSFISGGDSRREIAALGIGEQCWGAGCRKTRKDLNRLVAKIRPDFVAFTGDYIRNNDIPFVLSSADDWSDWFEDWELTTGPDNRLTPIIHTLGNHEDAVDLDKLFDVSNTDVYYATNFGGDLFRLYTLNSEPSNVCQDLTQLNWLENDLQQYSSPSNTPSWKFVQYHQPMVPHANYGPRKDMINCWTPFFKDYNVSVAFESHAHVLKTTQPLMYTQSGGTYENLTRNDTFGTVFLGDGSWGAPTRDLHSTVPIADVTMDAEEIAGFFFVNVSKDSVLVQTIIPWEDSIAAVGQNLGNAQGNLLPANTPLWYTDSTMARRSHHLVIKPQNRTLTKLESLEDKALKQIKVSPNPVRGKNMLVDLGAQKEPVRIEIYDAHGKLCKTYNKVASKTLNIDVSELCSGVNFLNVITKEDVKSVKFVVVH